MTPEETYNALPEGFEGEQNRRTAFDSAEEKLSYDADGLITLAKRTYKKEIVTVGEVVDLTTRQDDNVDGLRRAIAIKLKNPEQVEIDEMLMSLVAKPINVLSEAQRTVKGRVRSGEEIARAIPYVAAFLNEVNLQKQDGVLLDFFELNETGQLVMKDDCPEAYSLGENALQARMRQTRIVYREEDGQTKVMTGEECFKVTKRDKASRPLEMEVSEAARNITPKLIIMARGLPTLKVDGEKHTGEYARMNTGQFEKAKYTWTDDDSLDGSRARNAYWYGRYGNVHSFVRNSDYRDDDLGSRGVLRVNLNLEA